MTTLPSRKELSVFMEVKEVKEWLQGTQLKPRTQQYYTRFLYEYLDGEAPKSLVERALKDHRSVTMEIKQRIGQRMTKSAVTASHMQSALRSFLNYYETGVQITGKVRIQRKWRKPYISWEEADQIIAKAKPPYDAIFNFMRWCGIGGDEFMEINRSEDIQRRIQEQMKNDKDYVIIDLEPRKHTLNDYYIVCPKKVLPTFPINTRRLSGHPPKLVVIENLDDNFKRSIKAAGHYQIGVGPHTFRSIFTSQCAKLGVDHAITEFVKGHGTADAYGYNREVLDHEYAAKELRKLWNMSKPASESEVNILRQANEKMRELFTLQLQDTELSKHHDEIRAVLAKPSEGGPRAQKLSVRERNLQRELEEVDRKIGENREKQKRLLKEMETPRGRTGEYPEGNEAVGS